MSKLLLLSACVNLVAHYSMRDEDDLVPSIGCVIFYLFPGDHPRYIDYYLGFTDSKRSGRFPLTWRIPRLGQPEPAAPDKVTLRITGNGRRSATGTSG